MESAAPSNEDPGRQPGEDDPEFRTRLRFSEFEKEVFPDGRSTIRVTLEWTEGRTFETRVEGSRTREGETRAAARAVLSCAEQATEDRLSLELMGSKAVRVFDSWVVIVSARGRSDAGSYRLIGAYACPDDRTARGAALAALNATNRILEKYMPS